VQGRQIEVAEEPAKPSPAKESRASRVPQYYGNEPREYRKAGVSFDVSAELS